jgi:hypothetical protein
MGISLRAQLFYANMGHLVLVRSDGTVSRTSRNENEKLPDVILGQIDPYDPEAFVPFEIAMDDEAWEIQVGAIKGRVPFAEMGLVFSAGRVLVQTFLCRVGIRHVEVLPN